jgi:hypothetical protein
VDTLINPEAEPSPPITNEVPKSVGVEWTQPVPEVCIIVVEHSVSENFEMKPSNEMVVKQEGEDSSSG